MALIFPIREPDGANGARVVWEWHIWDHLIQNVDPALPNYGNPAEQPGRIDINGDSVGQANAPGNPTQDVFHVNSVAYNVNLDQIIISVPNFNEVWVIDHSTTTAEAAGTTGGRFGRGGELLYRWGNPQVYGRGTAADRKLGFQHDARWIPEGFPGAGNLMIFSNRSPADAGGAGGAGGGRGGGFGGFGGGFGGRTEVLELTPPVDERGRYRLDDGAPFGPAEPVWKYSADDFNATFISGASRLANGNTLITAGPQGRLFEVDSTGKIVWEYWSPYGPNTDVLGASAQSPYAVFRAIRIPPDHPGLAGLAN